MKLDFSVVELDRIVKFLDGLNKLAHQYKIGLYADGDGNVRLQTEAKRLPLVLDTYADGNELVVVVAP